MIMINFLRFLVALLADNDFASILYPFLLLLFAKQLEKEILHTSRQRKRGFDNH
jgi:hypothetical protein